jgi:diguanylate cyclase (GGDEF)-like protein
MEQLPTPRRPRRRLAPVPYALLFVALVGAATTFVWRDFNTSVTAGVANIERDAALVAELATASDGSLDLGPIAAFAPRHLERIGGRIELVDSSGTVLYEAGSAPQGAAGESLAHRPRVFNTSAGEAWLEVSAPLDDDAGAVRITTSYDDLQDRVLAEARGRYAGFGTAALLVVLTLLLVVEFFLRRSSRLQELVSQNRHWALHDELTGLPNRALFRDRALQSLGHARRNASGVAIMIMDLDRFKEVNDSLGHHHGDLLLKEVSQRLTAALREVDTVARFGGDEFAVLLTDADEDAAIHKVVAKILEAVRLPLVLDGFTISIDASIGVAVAPRHGDDFETLMKRADVAMYQAKAVGGGFEIYTRPELRRQADAHTRSQVGHRPGPAGAPLPTATEHPRSRCGNCRGASALAASRARSSLAPRIHSSCGGLGVDPRPLPLGSGERSASERCVALSRAGCGTGRQCLRARPRRPRVRG